MSSLESLTVSSVERLTPDAVALCFDVPEARKDAFRFTPGQYLTLEADIDGAPVRRSYSICSLPGEPLKVGIKKVSGGKFSTFANEVVEAGTVLRALPPSGRFTVREADRALHHVGFAAGSGITPILSIIGHVLESRPDDRFTLFYGNRSLGQVMFIEAIHRLKDRFLDRLIVHHFLSRESTDLPHARGRLDAAKIATLVEGKLLEVDDMDAAYVCGPGDMIDAVTTGLSAAGIDEARVVSERFTSAYPGGSAPAVSTRPEGTEVEVRVDGLTRSFVVPPGGQLIEAASQAGVDVPWSCSGGMCSTCRCKLVEGEADMAVNYALEPWELEKNYILACQTVPRSDRIVLDFDDQ